MGNQNCESNSYNICVCVCVCVLIYIYIQIYLSIYICSLSLYLYLYLSSSSSILPVLWALSVRQANGSLEKHFNIYEYLFKISGSQSRREIKQRRTSNLVTHYYNSQLFLQPQCPIEVFPEALRDAGKRLGVVQMINTAIQCRPPSCDRRIDTLKPNINMFVYFLRIS